MEMPKPLIFVNPLSPSPQKLREVINETSSEDGIEIYECEDLNEANQLIRLLVLPLHISHLSYALIFYKLTEKL